MRTSVSLADGGSLDLEVDGPDHGDVLLMHHRTPGSSVLYGDFVREGASRGLRLASYS
jgi:hypothetical protein